MSLARNARRLWKKNKKVPPARNKVFLEPLEPRILLDAITAHWIGGSGNWSDATHWSGGVVPNDGGGNTYTAIIDAAGNPTVDVTQGIKVSGLINNDAIHVDNGGTLTASGNLTNTGDLTAAGGTLRFDNATVANTGHAITLNGGTVQLASTTIIGGTVQTTGSAGSLSISGSSTFDAVTLNAPTTMAYSTTLTVKNGLTLNSTLTLPSYAWLYFNGTQTLSGTGEVIFGGTASNSYIYSRGTDSAHPATLTIGSSITIHGTQGGTIQGQYTNDSLINQGTIKADTTGKTITVNFSNWTNTGLLKAEKGTTLSLTGSVTNTDAASIDGTGGTIQMSNGTVTNTGRTIQADTLSFSNTTVIGGTILAGSLSISGSSTFDAVTLNAPTTMAYSTTLTVKNGLTLNSTLTLPSYAWLYFNGTQTLSGTGEVIFGGTASNSYIYSRGTDSAHPATLTIGSSITIHGTQGGTIQGQYTNDSLINQGTIKADTTGKTITVSSLTNQGVISIANGASMDLNGSTTLREFRKIKFTFHPSTRGNK